MIQTPKLDWRTREEIVAHIRDLIPAFVPSWARGPGKPWPGGDPGAALVEIFARFMEVIIERLNRVPDKNLLAFLEMIGVSLLPPMPARAPVQFFLAAGATDDGSVPEGTPLATAGPAPLTFETEKDLTVTPARLVKAITHDPRSDRYTAHGNPGSPEAPGGSSFQAFAGRTLIEHILYLGQDTLFRVTRPTTLRLRFDLGTVTRDRIPFLSSFLRSLSWWIQAGGKPVLLQPYFNQTFISLSLRLRGTVHTGGVASSTLTGVGTTFTAELREGDTITIPGAGDRAVTRITSDTSLQMNRDATVAGPPGVVAARVRPLTLNGLIHTGGASSTTLTGWGTVFTQQLLPGDTISIPGVGARVVTAIASDTSLTMDLAVTIPGPPGVVADRVQLPTLRGTVHTGGIASSTLTGVGTAFTAELRVGDTIVIPDVGTRVVMTIASDTSLTMHAAATITGPPGVAAARDQALLFEGAFPITSGIEARAVHNLLAYWLWSKTEVPLPVRKGDLPVVHAVSARTQLNNPIPPDRAFTNNLPIDLAKKGFFPFGERPRINDAFYIGSEEVFSRKGASITIDVTLSFPIKPDPDKVPTVTLAWEFWNGDTWNVLGTMPTTNTITTPVTPQDPYQFMDLSGAFTVPGTRRITFRAPEIFPREVNGQNNYWIRVRIDSGGYGEDAKLTKVKDPPQTLADWKYDAATFRPPFTTTLTLSYAYEDFQEMDHLLTHNNFVYQPIEQGSEGGFPAFTPFQPPEDADPALYLGFDRKFSNRPVSLYLAVVEQPQIPSAPLVTWEYRHGKIWENLGIQDETKTLTQAGMAEFIGPADSEQHVEFGSALYWIRARLEEARLQPGEKSLFSLSGVYPNTAWARQAITLYDEVIGSSTGKPRQVFALSRFPVLKGEQIEVREPEPPSPEEIRALEEEGERDPVRVIRDEVRNITEVWVRWHGVEHFYLSKPTSRYYVIDRAAGQVRFGDGMRGMIPPPARDNIRAARYQAGGGRKGNVAAGTITVMKRAFPLIDRVSNPAAAGGGSDQENLDAVKARGPLTIKHRDRAITYEDCEWLAKEASIHVARARCIGAKDGAAAGKIALLIVPESEEPKPFPSPGLIRQVKAFLETRRTPTADLSVVGPAYVEVSVAAEVVPTSFGDADLVRRRIVQALTAFLHPLTGGPEKSGWAFGRDVFLSEIAALIEEAEGVDHVREATISGTADTEDRTLTRDGKRLAEVPEGKGERVEVREGELVASGAHTITMVGA